jgi:VPDSG-CTERM motif
MLMKKLKYLTAVATLASALTFSARAATIDLTSGPPAQGTTNGAIFAATDLQPTGTGVFMPFLRAQQHGNTPGEQGYNTDGGFPFNDKNPHNFQHSITLASLAEFNISGVEYYKFTLDANNSGKTAHNFSLDQLQIYTTNSPAQTTTALNPDGTIAFDATTHLAYDLNPGGGTTNNVLTTGTGSGKADLFAFIPVSDFVPAKYVILYFASGTNLKATGGFEEWSADGTPRVPDSGATVMLLGGALTCLGAVRRYLKR